MKLQASPEGERELAERTADSLAALGAGEARALLVLGSGLGGVVEAAEDARELPLAELPHLPRSRVPGHAGRLLLGRLGGEPVLLQEGRVHLYEGGSPREVTRLVRACATLGVGHLVLTCSAGGLLRELPVGGVVLLEDHVNLQGRAPLLRGEQCLGRPYDAGWARELERAARELSLPLARGVYAGLLGPCYETPAEIRMLARLGVAAVGMSTVCEAAVGRASGMRVAGLASISNLAAGIQAAPLDHEEVLAAGRAASELLARVIRRALRAVLDAGARPPLEIGG